MKTVIIVQARMTSTRLPGKVLMTVLGKPLLEYQVERLRRVTKADDIVIATTTNDTDEPIVTLCSRLTVRCFRGSEENVLARYHGAALSAGAETVVRVTSDCPLIDPQVMDGVIRFYLDNRGSYDYVSNTLKRSFPQGLDTEVFSLKALDEAFRVAKSQVEQEHVTPFFYLNPQRYRIGQFIGEHDHSRHRWTVDTPEDFELLRRILEELYPRHKNFLMADVLRLLDEHPAWPEINAHILQKKLGE